MSDFQRELQQKSLRNVRALLDKEEEELRRQKKTTRLLLFVIVPLVAVAILGAAIWVGRKPDAMDPRLLECQTKRAAEMSGERERAIRAENPALPAPEVAARMRAESTAIQAAAGRECGAKVP